MPTSPEETKLGIEYLRNIFQSGNILTLADPRILRMGLAEYFHFQVSAYSKTWDFCLTRSNLNDLPSTPGHREGAATLAHAIENRLRNAEAYLYMTASYRMLYIEPIWPPRIYLGETSASVPVRIIDRETSQEGSCYVRLDTWYFHSVPSPYQQFEDIVNSIRRSFDTEEISIAPDPPRPQFIALSSNCKVPQAISTDNFIQQKVWKLGLLAGLSPNNVVWLSDPWDLEYFNIAKSKVLQRAAVLNAQNKIALQKNDDDFALVGQAMLAQEGPDSTTAQAKQAEEFRTALEIYKHVGELGEGGAGRVLQVEDPDGERFALKYLKPEGVSTQRSKRFKNEIRFCALSNHPNIVRVLDWGVATVQGIEVPFYVMPVYSKTLKTVMSSKPDSEILLDLFDQILAGVQAAHEHNVWHRDLKPQNVLIDSTGKHAVVSDFGIAHFAEPLLHTLVHTNKHERLANFQYAAPEQRNNSTVTHLADIFSLGVILYEMFTGEMLQGTDHTPIGTLRPECSFLDPIVTRMSQQSPAKRFPTVAEVRALLAQHNL
jgi:hypothetical protein